MATKKLNEVTTVTSLSDSEFITVTLSDGSVGKIKRSDLYPAATLISSGLMSISDKRMQARANWFRAYNYTNGALIKTNVPASPTAMFLLEITINSYMAGVPQKFLIQGYNSTNAIVYAYGSLICGAGRPVCCFIHNGYLCFWLQQSGVNQTILIKGDFFSDNYYITNVSNQAMPTDANNLVEVTPV